MSTLTAAFSRSIGQKLIMGLTGLFLVSFLLVHLSGNLQLFLQDGGVAFNTYTKFMTTNPVIKVMEWVLFAGFIIHIIYGVRLTAQNRSARPVRYAAKTANTGASWASRNMFVSGSILFIFLVVHLYMFWGVYHFGGGETVTVEQAYQNVWKVTDDGAFNFDKYISYEQYMALSDEERQQTVEGLSMFKLAKEGFQQWWIVLLYVVAMGLLAFHLNHGFQSAFRTLGLVHKKYMPLIKSLGVLIAVVFPVAFAAMPLYFFLF
jgi:succinate dehydrogenase / fumarate reductase cytochrome b subunit